MDGDGTGDTGGDVESDNNNGWNDENSGTLWGWLDSVVGGLVSIWESIKNLPSLIWDKVKTGFDGLESSLTKLLDNLKNLPDNIKEKIMDIFVPDTEQLESSFMSFIYELKMKFSFNTEFFDTLFDEDRPVTDIFAEYDIPNVGKFNFKFFDVKYLYEGVTYFRPFIRGFIVLLLVLYNIRMALSFIRQDAGIVAGKSVSMANKKE